MTSYKTTNQSHLSLQDTYQEGRIRGLVDVCLKIQHDEKVSTGDTWLSDDYIRGLMYDTAAAGAFSDVIMCIIKLDDLISNDVNFRFMCPR